MRRRWLKSVVVLLIGLAYLGGVYWASPALRREMRFSTAWYGWPWQGPPRAHYRVGTDLALKNFEQRLIEHAEATQSVRMTIDVTERSRHAGIRYDGESLDGEEFVSPLRERHYTAALLLERGSHPDSTARMKLVVEGENWWCAWFRRAGDDRYLLADQTASKPEFVCRSISRTHPSTLIWDDDEERPIVDKRIVPLWPFVCPSAFDRLLDGTRVSRGDEAEINGRPCRSVRIERRWEKSTPIIWTLWMPKDEDRVVKVEYVPPMNPELVEKLTDAELAELGTVCIVTSYEEPDASDFGGFDPVPLLERWATEAAEAVASDVEKLEERKSSGGGFGGFGFGEEPDDDGSDDGDNAEEGATQ